MKQYNSLGSYSYEIQNQIKLIYSDTSQDIGYLRMVLIRRQYKSLLGAGNSLYLDLGWGVGGTYVFTL